MLNDFQAAYNARAHGPICVVHMVVAAVCNLLSKQFKRIQTERKKETRRHINIRLTVAVWCDVTEHTTVLINSPSYLLVAFLFSLQLNYLGCRNRGRRWCCVPSSSASSFSYMWKRLLPRSYSTSNFLFIMLLNPACIKNRRRRKKSAFFSFLVFF